MSDQIHIPYIDELLSSWNAHPETYFLKDISQFDSAILIISSHIIHLDGQYNWFERHFIKEFFENRLSADTIEQAQNFIELNLTRSINLDRLFKEFNQVTTEDVRLQFAFFLFDLSKSDGQLRTIELNLIKDLCKKMEISDDHYQKIQTKYQMFNPELREQFIKNLSSHPFFNNPKLDAAYKTLGLNSNSSEAEIKKKYRSLVQEHHPDKMKHLGEKYYRTATELLKKINDAYEYILSQKK